MAAAAPTRRTPVSTWDIAVVGLGEVALTRHLPVLTQHPRFRVVALADIDPERTKQVAAQFKIPQTYPAALPLLERSACDLVAVLTPPAEHASIVHQVLQAGKHVFCEKPLTLSLPEAEEIAARARRSKRTLFMGFNMRHHRLVQQLVECLETGALGEVKTLHTVLTRKDSRALAGNWRTQAEEGGDLLFDLGVHQFDLWRYLLRQEIAKVYAGRSLTSDGDESVVMVAQTEWGVQITSTLAEGTAEQGSLEVWGSQARVDVSNHRFDGFEFIPRGELDGSLQTRMSGIANMFKGLPQGAARNRQGGDFALSYMTQWDDVCAALDGKDSPVARALDGLAATRIALAARQSIETGLPVSLKASPATATEPAESEGETTEELLTLPDLLTDPEPLSGEPE